jgi:hypothetical protein
MSKWLSLFLENEIVNRSDKSDRFRFETNMSGLSLHPRGLLDEKLEKVENNHSKGGDKSDRFKLEPNMSGLSGPELRENFEERLAISEYDGQQTHLQAQRIAYLDAFISILSTLAEDDPRQDWLAQKIQIALVTLEAQNFPTLN